MEPFEERAKQILDSLAYEFHRENVSVELQYKIVWELTFMLRHVHDEALAPFRDLINEIPLEKQLDMNLKKRNLS